MLIIGPLLVLIKRVFFDSLTAFWGCVGEESRSAGQGRSVGNKLLSWDTGLVGSGTEALVGISESCVGADSQKLLDGESCVLRKKEEVVETKLERNRRWRKEKKGKGAGRSKSM